MKEQISFWLSILTPVAGITWRVWVMLQERSRLKHQRTIESLEQKQKEVRQQSESPIHLQIYIGERLFTFLFLALLLVFIVFAGVLANNMYQQPEDRLFVFFSLGLELAAIMGMIGLLTINTLERLRALKNPDQLLERLQDLIEIERRRDKWVTKD